MRGPTAPKRLTVRERIDPNLTASLFANYRGSADAVMELIDNAIDSRRPRTPLEIELTLHPASLVIQSQGGEGMVLREIERDYLRWGASPKRGKHLLGQYGQGGKAAVGHLGTRFTIEAARAADATAWRFTDPDYRNRAKLKTYEIQETARRVPPGQGYFRIRIDGVDKRVDQRRLSARLIETYRPLLEDGTLLMKINGSPLQPEPLHTAERREFTANVAGGRLRGWLGTADPDQPNPGWEPGIRCYKLGRLIGEGEFFGHPGPAQLPSMVRLMGEVDIPQVQLTMNKSDFERDSNQWAEVEARLHRQLAPLVKLLRRDGDAPPPQSAVKVAEQVRRLLGQALRLAERADLFAGSTAAPRTAQKERDLLPMDLEPPPPAAPPEPRDPPAEPATDPARQNRKGFGNIVIRALEPRTRSTTAVEDGVRMIVINSNYPLFKERHGDVWYQLETAIRELCAAEESSSVEDYEQRVSELILAVGDLRARRRRHPRSGAQLSLTVP